MGFGNNVKRIREESGMTQKELAVKVGISQPSLSYIESETNKPDFDTIVALAKALETTVGKLFGDDGVGVDEEKRVIFSRVDKEVKEGLTVEEFNHLMELRKNLLRKLRG